MKWKGTQVRKKCQGRQKNNMKQSESRWLVGIWLLVDYDVIHTQTKQAINKVKFYSYTHETNKSSF